MNYSIALTLCLTLFKDLVSIFQNQTRQYKSRRIQQSPRTLWWTGGFAIWGTLTHYACGERKRVRTKKRERERKRCVVIFTKKADGTSSFYACYAVSRRQHNHFYLFHSANKIARVRQTTKNYNHQLHAQIHVSFLSSFAPNCISFRTSVYILVQTGDSIYRIETKILASHRAFSLHPFNFHVDIADQTSVIVGLRQKCLNA